MYSLKNVKSAKYMHVVACERFENVRSGKCNVLKILCVENVFLVSSKQTRIRLNFKPL